MTQVQPPFFFFVTMAAITKRAVKIPLACKHEMVRPPLELHSGVFETRHVPTLFIHNCVKLQTELVHVLREGIKNVEIIHSKQH